MSIKTARGMARLCIAAMLLALCSSGTALAQSSGSASKVTWQSCVPGAKQYVGAYRIFDNAFRGPSSKDFCVHSTGLNITIDSDAVAVGGVVVAYPSVRFGAFFTDGDPQSGLPVPVTGIGTMTLVVASRGSASGQWLSDVDIWFRPRANWQQHGSFELVIANRSGGFGAPRGTKARINGLAYRVDEWTAHDPITGEGWPILVFHQVRQTVTAKDKVGAFVYWARRHGHLPRSAWLGDVAYGSELWHGGRGLTDSMTVTWPGTPVLP